MQYIFLERIWTHAQMISDVFIEKPGDFCFGPQLSQRFDNCKC